MASAYKLPIHPHRSMTGLYHAASNLVSNPGTVDKDGNVWPLDKPGLGLDVDEDLLAGHPAIEGPGYI
jgi:L-alanine-DL-glutamate epimerase-like enolase superfamily enzyme